MKIPFRRPTATPVPPGITVNNGEPLELSNPFTRMAIKDGAITLWGEGSTLLVTANGRAYLTGTVSKSMT